MSKFKWPKNGLKTQIRVDSEVITGDYQILGSGLQIRFAGKDDSAVATAGDEWEIECIGKGERVDNSSGPNATKLTRTDVPYRKYKSMYSESIKD